MEKGFPDNVEDNAAVRIWAETTQQQKGDSLTEGCFTFGKVDLVPTIEEYTTLLRCPRIQVDKAYFRAANVPTFSKKLMNITGMWEQWVTARIKQKGDCKCIHWRNLRDLILVHPDMKKRVDVFALSIYGLVIFPKALGHIDEIIECLSESGQREIHRMRTNLTSLVPQPFLESGKSLISYLLRKLLSTERVSGYAETGWYYRGKVDDDLIMIFRDKFYKFIINRS
ncbi:hypothetical protein CXB51_032282 [Gossypium anomalum]|uniref:DUF7745 domain-containing protein n=1 Tax=Gossypium anomalum TaxID=47600 RepID=A0A8J6CKB0_9ROSI|nr:hypothetical protein CXB51_032282 [Gossypium anomalum]